MKVWFKYSVALTLLAGFSVFAGMEEEKDLTLIKAVESGQIEKVEKLLASGYDLSVTDRNKEGALIYAIRAENLEMTRFLVEKGAALEASNTFKMTPLLVAANIGHYEICKLLLEHGADVNAADFEGMTPFMNAAAGDNIPLVDLFVEHGAALNAVDKNGRSALDLIRFTPYEKTIKHLESLGVELKKETSYDRSKAEQEDKAKKSQAKASSDNNRFQFLPLPEGTFAGAVKAHAEAMKQIDNRRFMDAGSHFREAYEKAPRCKEALHNLATFVFQTRNTALIQDIEPQILNRYDLTKEHAGQISLNIGTAVGTARPLDNDRFQKAQIWLRQAVALTDAKDPEALFFMGELYEAGGIYDQAELHYKEILNVAPGSKWSARAKDRLEVVENLKKGIVILPAKDEDGNAFSMADYKGKVVLVDLWASWCKPCLMAGPFLEGWDRMSEKKPVAVVGINTDRQHEAYLKSVAKEEITWKQYLDPHQEVGSMFGSNSLPTFLVFNHEGKLVYKTSGWSGTKSKELNIVLNRYIKEAKKAAKNQ